VPEFSRFPRVSDVHVRGTASIAIYKKKCSLLARAFFRPRVGLFLSACACPTEDRGKLEENGSRSDREKGKFGSNQRASMKKLLF
jgi:hypothetical protein